MWKLFLIILILSWILTGCVGLAPLGPQELKMDDNVYITGFYGDLYPNDYEITGEQFECGDLVLKMITHNAFDLYHADIGSNIRGTIYCAEKDYENALAFYNDPQNYSYYCILGVNSDTQSSKTIKLSDMDCTMFDAFLDFARQSKYDPFNEEHNSKIEKIDLPMPDDTKDTRLIFYKQSKDYLFTSLAGPECYILNGQLYIVYRYDYGHGEYEKLIAVKVPDDISTYFVEYMKAYM